MQTFLPYADFERTAASLDYRRLGNQRSEAKKIYLLLVCNATGGWSHHPAVRMWRGYENALAMYHDCCIREWSRRGYVNNMPLLVMDRSAVPEMPWWLGNEDFHRSHRAKLIQKKPEYYSGMFPLDRGFNDSEYWWPDNDSRTFKIIIGKTRNPKRQHINAGAGALYSR